MRELNLPLDVEVLVKKFKEARAASAVWATVAKGLREQLNMALAEHGYTQDRDNLSAETLRALAGETLFEVKPVPQSRLNLDLLRRDHPGVYQACLDRSTSYTVVVPDDNSDLPPSIADDDSNE